MTRGNQPTPSTPRTAKTAPMTSVVQRWAGHMFRSEIDDVEETERT